MKTMTISRWVLMQGMIFLMLASSLSAQSVTNWLRKGDDLYAKLFYEDAAKCYQQAVTQDPHNQHAYERLGDCFRKMGNSRIAETYYSRVVDGNPTHPSYHYYYACALMNNGRYDAAASAMEKYLTLSPEDVMAQRKLESCRNAGEFTRNENQARIMPAAFNTPSSEFSPSFWGDKIIFASARGEKAWLLGPSAPARLDLFAADWNGGTEISNCRKLEGDVNTDAHESNAVISPGGKRMFFTRNANESASSGTGGNNILMLQTFSAELRNGKAVNVQSLPFNDPSYSTGHPALTPDGIRMVFVSDMPGGEGGTDLWVSLWSGNRWDDPVNLGPSINTPGNEMFPWISPEGTLFFSSDGLKGMGGLDLFRANYAAGKWVSPENMGSPFNSSFDDFGYVYDSRKNAGLFSSNREGGMGGDDIYSFSMNPKFEIQVVSQENGRPVKNAMVEISVAGNPLVQSYTNDKGVIIFYAPEYSEWDVNVFHPEFKEASRLYTMETFSATPRQTLALGRIGIEPPQSPIMIADENLTASTENFPTSGPQEFVGRVFYTVYYGKNSHEMPGSFNHDMQEVLQFMNKYPDAKIEIRSHTDSRGTDEFNEELSHRRAKEAFEFLSVNGIDKGRMNYTWYGERAPVNSCGDGVECGEDEVALNRRTEFRLLPANTIIAAEQKHDPSKQENYSHSAGRGGLSE